MKVGRAAAMSVIGVEGCPVRIEAVMMQGLPAVTIVGLPDTAVSESRERVRAAFESAGIRFPRARLTINLSPADLPKTGTAFDVGIAVAILGTMGGDTSLIRGYVMGELGLDGSIRQVRGILPASLAAAKEGEPMIVPKGCADEASLAGNPVTEVWHLAQIAQMMGISCGPVPQPPAPHHFKANEVTQNLDLSDVRGQLQARHALEVAAAGGHHLIMTGAPGVGKSMLASRMPGILPQLSVDQAVEVASVLSTVGEFTGELSTTPPYSSPHHTSSAAALVGGGSIPRPGAISRAHNGVLFLDEMPEFSSKTLQALREPMETGKIEIHRAKAVVKYPARFQLIGAANPCRCGDFLDRPRLCHCSVRDRRNYFGKIGGPILDRFDISVVLPRLTRAELMGVSAGEGSKDVAARVLEARERQKRRLRDTPWKVNAQVSGQWCRREIRLAPMLHDHLVRGEISMRAADKILRLSWTVADLSGRDQPSRQDMATAFALHSRGRR